MWATGDMPNAACMTLHACIEHLDHLLGHKYTNMVGVGGIWVSLLSTAIPSCPRGVAALEQLPNLEVLRLGGTGASASVAVSKFGQRVTLSTVPKHRIWWMLDAS